MATEVFPLVMCMKEVYDEIWDGGYIDESLLKLSTKETYWSNTVRFYIEPIQY